MPSRGHDRRPLNLEPRVFYSVAELARAGNVPTYRLRRILRRHGVVFLRSGRAFYVPMAEIQRKIPSLWESLCALNGLRRGARK
jgi:hypothetical protein